MPGIRPPWYRSKIRPFPWQKEAVELGIKSLMQGEKGVIRAATGTGKSAVQIELAQCLFSAVRRNERIVISVPKQALVDQMYEDLNKRIPGRCRRWYQFERKTDRPVIIACHASMMNGRVRDMDKEPLTPKEMNWRKRKRLPLVPLKGTALQLALLANRDIDHLNVAFEPDENSLAVEMLRKGLKTSIWIADEVHQTECLRILTWATLAQPERRLGFTATPFRTDRDQRITLFEKEIEGEYLPYDIYRAIEDKIIVEPRVIPYQGTSKDIDEACAELIKMAPGVGIVNAWNIEDAEYYAQYLRERGIPCAAIHSRLSKGEQKTRERDLKRRKYKCLVHVNLLSEGRNFPWLFWLCLRRSSTKKDEWGEAVYAEISRTRFVQEVGRVLRAYEEKGVKKKFALVFDPNGLFHRLQLSYEALLGMPDDFSVRIPQSRSRDNEEEDIRIRPLSLRNPIVRWINRLAYWLKANGKADWLPPDERDGEVTKEQYMKLKVLAPRAMKCRVSTDFKKSLHAAVSAALRFRLTKPHLHDLISIMTTTVKEGRWPG